MHTHNTEHNFTYSQSLADQHEIAADDAAGLFVNCTTANVHLAVTNGPEAAQAQFEGLIAGQYNTVDDTAWPVLIYQQDNHYVAWYDWENICGYKVTV